MNDFSHDMDDDRLNEIFQREEPQVFPQAPHNLEVEQRLLGAVLVNNDALFHVDDELLSEHFYELLHQKIFKTIKEMREANQSATPITLGFNQPYLFNLAVLSTDLVIDVSEYARIIIDLHLKRKLIEVSEKAILSIRGDIARLNGIEKLSEIEESLFRLSQKGSVSATLAPFSVAAKKAAESSEMAQQADGSMLGVTSGLKALDVALGGFQGSDLIIIAGRPSMGKTALATTIAHKAAQHFQRLEERKSVAFFSLEMSDEQLANRIIASECNLNSQAILRGSLTPEENNRFIQASKSLCNMPMLIDDTAGISMSALRSRARRFMRMHNIGLIVVDYLQLLTIGERSRSSNRVQEITEITQGLKALAKELHVPVIALSQLSRAVEQRDDKRPQLSDLRESGSIEQDADVVMFVYREQYYLDRAKPEEGSAKYNKWVEDSEISRGKAEIIIAKQRHGAIGNVMLKFDGDKARFRD